MTVLAARAAIVVALWLGWACHAAAQQSAATPPPASEQTDIQEWLRQHLKKDAPTVDPATASQAKSVLFAPIIGTKPSTGVTLGVGVSVEFPLGALNDTFMSSTLTGVSVSTKKQYGVSSRLLLFGSGNAWAVTGDNHLKTTGQETYEFGTEASGASVSTTFHSIRVVDTYLRRLPHNLYAGLGFLYQRQQNVVPVDGKADWAQSPYVTYSEQFGFDLAGQTSAGLSAVVRRDRRDSLSDPARGAYAELAYRGYFTNFLGGASTWQAVSFDLRAYRPMPTARRHTLAVWGYGEFVTGGHAPYFALPATGTDPQGRSGRGYPEGQFRGDRLVYGEIEYRATLRRDGLVGMVAFLNATAVGATFVGDPLFDQVSAAGGFGFRLRLDKRSRTNLCLDFGFGRHGSHGVYISMAEAF